MSLCQYKVLSKKLVSEKFFKRESVKVGYCLYFFTNEKINILFCKYFEKTYSKNTIQKHFS